MTDGTTPETISSEETTTEVSTTSFITPLESNEGDHTAVKNSKTEPVTDETVLEEPSVEAPAGTQRVEKEANIEETSTRGTPEQQTPEPSIPREAFNEAKTLQDQEPGEISSQITATMRFLEPWDSSRGIPYIRINPCQTYDRMNFKWQDYSVHITNARAKIHDFDLDFHGFTYINDDISPSLIKTLRENKIDTVREQYYPRVIELAKKITGGKRVIIFDHTQRKRRLEVDDFSKNDDGKEQPATMVHCDQSPESAIRRLRENLHPWEDVDSVLKGRVRMIK